MALHEAVEFDRHCLEADILPGERHSPQLRAALHELLERIEQGGHGMDIHSVGRILADFVPSLPPERAEEWQERALQHWLLRTKPELIERLADYFIY